MFPGIFHSDGMVPVFGENAQVDSADIEGSAHLAAKADIFIYSLFFVYGEAVARHAFYPAECCSLRIMLRILLPK